MRASCRHCNLAGDDRTPGAAERTRAGAVAPVTGIAGTRLWRYLLRRTLFAASLTLLVLLAIVLSLFVAELLGDVADGRLFGGAVLRMLVLRIPEAVLLVGPLALVVGLLMTFGELAAGEEFSVMRTAGARPGTVWSAAGTLALVWALALVAIGGWLQPWARTEAAELANRSAADWLLAAIQPGRFSHIGVSGLTIYARGVDADRGVLEGVFIHHTDGRREEVISARRGRFEADPHAAGARLSLFDGTHTGHAAGPGGLPLRHVRFARNDVDLPVRSRTERVPEAARLSLPVLMAGGAALRTELHRRIAPALIGLALVPLVLPLSLRGGRHRHVAPALLLIGTYLLYSNLVQMLLAQADAGSPSAERIAWGAHAGAFAAGAWVLVQWWRRW